MFEEITSERREAGTCSAIAACHMLGIITLHKKCGSVFDQDQRSWPSYTDNYLGAPLVHGGALCECAQPSGVADDLEPVHIRRMTGHNDGAGSLASSNPVRVRFDTFELDEANARLLRDGKAVAVAPTPFALLCTLVRQQGSLLTKNALLDEVWGHQFVSDSVLKTAISDLRTVLDDDPRKPRFIETVSRRGYRFIAPTTTATPLAKGAQTARSRRSGLSVAQKRLGDFTALGSVRATASVPWSGLPASLASARRH